MRELSIVGVAWSSMRYWPSLCKQVVVVTWNAEYSTTKTRRQEIVRQHGVRCYLHLTIKSNQPWIIGPETVQKLSKINSTPHDWHHSCPLINMSDQQWVFSTPQALITISLVSITKIFKHIWGWGRSHLQGNQVLWYGETHHLQS
jgi:hypothetical protein